MEVKKVNIFFPCLLFLYLALDIGYVVLKKAGVINPPAFFNMIFSELLVLLIVIIYLLIVRVNPFKEFRIKVVKPLDCILCIISGYLLIPIMMIINVISSLFTPNYAQTTLSETLSFPFWAQVVMIAVIPAMVEEFTFRGLFYGSYRRNAGFAAIALSGLLFGCFHLNFNQCLYATVLGMFFAVISEACGSIVGSMLAHFAINTYSIGLYEIMKLAGVDIDAMLTAASSDSTAVSSVSSVSLISLAISLIFYLAIAAATTALAILIIRFVAKRNNNLDHLKEIIRPKSTARVISDDNQAGKKEKLFTIPIIASIIACVAYMIFMDFMYHY